MGLESASTALLLTGNFYMPSYNFGGYPVCLLISINMFFNTSYAFRNGKRVSINLYSIVAYLTVTHKRNILILNKRFLILIYK